ncbi:MAG TPA: hypothetical protein VF163_09155 [Micromonosporaceae bacterium]
MIDWRAVHDPTRLDTTRAELDELGLKHFVDVRATARRMLVSMGRDARTAFAAAVTERLLREEEGRPASERGQYLSTWRPVLDAVWRGLAGDPAATGSIAAGVAHFYLGPDFLQRRHDDPADADDHAIMAACFTAECFLHGCLEFAVWVGWRGFDRATLRTAADRAWPHRRPPEVSPYAWELAHPEIQAELDRQLADLELLSPHGEALPEAPAERRSLLDALRLG